MTNALILETIKYRNCNVTLGKETVLWDDNTHFSAQGSAITINSGIVTMKDNAGISGFKSRDKGGAVFNNNCEFVMAGSSYIIDCNSSDGGAVYLKETNATFIIKDGAMIETCKASSNGGPVRAPFPCRPRFRGVPPRC